MSADLHAQTMESLPAYALGCLDPEEAAAIAGHLAACPRCRAELVAYQEVAGRLPWATPEVAPPPALKERVMARVQAPAPVAAAAPTHGWQLGPFLSRALPLWAAVSAVLIVALTFSNLMLWQQINQTQAPSQTDAMVTVAMAGTEAAPGAEAIIIVGADGRRGALVADDLPPLDAQHQYQLWLIADGQRTSGGVFSVDEYGYGRLWVSSPRPLRDYSSFGITVEPAGGSPGPTGARVLAGSF
jgi:anti-sigma-K factor RskA